MIVITKSFRRAALGTAVAVAVVCGTTIGCAGTPTAPTPQLQIACPASPSVESPAGGSVRVEFESPQSSGGVQPINVTCTAASGSDFPVGTTSVNCTARDAKQQVASCDLNVTVKQVGTLSATRFMAFGDSITFGAPPTFCPGTSTRVTTRELIARDLRTLFEVTKGRAAPPSSYPSVLQSLLGERYVGQSPVVINEGVGGEQITEDGGTKDDTLNRLRTRLAVNQPEVLLLQEGINDLNSFAHHVEATEQLVKPLRDMIREARNRRAQVFLGTLLPTDPGGCRGGLGWDLVAPANDHIRALAASEGVELVDLFAAFGGTPGPHIGSEDGLHPTPVGYEKIARTFLESIKKTLEVPR